MAPLLDAGLSARISTVRLIAFDFDGVFTDNFVYTFQDGREAVRSWRGDGLGLEKLNRVGLAVIILSTESNPVVTARADKLKVRCVQGLSDKRAALERLAAESGLGLDQVAFVGNDINDLPCLTAVGLPMVVADAHPDVLPYAAYRTLAPGGQGAVREICDLFEAVYAHRSFQPQE